MTSEHYTQFTADMGGFVEVNSADEFLAALDRLGDVMPSRHDITFGKEPFTASNLWINQRTREVCGKSFSWGPDAGFGPAGKSQYWIKQQGNKEPHHA